MRHQNNSLFPDGSMQVGTGEILASRAKTFPITKSMTDFGRFLERLISLPAKERVKYPGPVVTSLAFTLLYMNYQKISHIYNGTVFIDAENLGAIARCDLRTWEGGSKAIFSRNANSFEEVAAHSVRLFEDMKLQAGLLEGIEKDIERQEILVEDMRTRADPSDNLALQERILKGMRLEQQNGALGLLIDHYSAIVPMPEEPARDDSNETFYRAVRDGNLEAARAASKLEGLDIDAINPDSGFNPLHEASYNGNKEMVKLLLKLGANINALDLDEFTPLVIALQKSDEVATFLIKKGANLNYKYPAQSPMHLAAFYGRVEAIRALKRREIDVDAVDESTGKSALHIACEEFQPEAAKALLDLSKDAKKLINKPWGTNTPLEIATKLGSIDVVNVLLSRGADRTIGKKIASAALAAGNEDILDRIRTFKASKSSSKTKSFTKKPSDPLEEASASSVSGGAGFVTKSAKPSAAASTMFLATSPKPNVVDEMAQESAKTSTVAGDALLHSISENLSKGASLTRKAVAASATALAAKAALYATDSLSKDALSKTEPDESPNSSIRANAALALVALAATAAAIVAGTRYVYNRFFATKDHKKDDDDFTPVVATKIADKIVAEASERKGNRRGGGRGNNS